MANGSAAGVAELAFQRFWAVYPRKEKKKRAQKVWARLNPSPELTATILADVTKRVTSFEWTRDGGQYVPQPSTYLIDARWEDESRAGAVAHGGALASAIEAKLTGDVDAMG
jgi:DNA replication protein DnaC